MNEPNDQNPSRRGGVQATQIAGAMRADIVAGRPQPGQQLETRVQIEQRFQASPVTVQRALDTLIAEGFVVSRGRLGTFVSEQPPHRNRWAILFPLTPQSNGWNRYFAGLLRETQRPVREGESIVPVFLARDGGMWRSEHERLAGDLRSGRLAGCIYVTKPAQLLPRDSPIPGLGRPAVTLSGPTAGVCSVILGGNWVERALGLLQHASRKRLAYIGSVPMAHHLAHSHALLSRYGLVLKEQWAVGINADSQATPLARDIVRLLLDHPGSERPDGLIIGDDNLRDAALAGIKDAGLAASNDLTVVSHANHPEPDQPAMPCIRLGYDLREIVRSALAFLIAQRDGQPAKDEVIQPTTDGDAHH